MNMSTRQSDISCIIPVHNEGTRILRVLEVVTQMKNLAEILCVDDGSSDNTHELVQKHFPKITLLRSKKNYGKTAAVSLGLKAVKTPYTMLLDGDLYNLKKEEIQDAIQVISADKTVDMIVFRRLNDPWYSKLCRGDISVTGERIMRTEDLKQVMTTKPEGYQLEFAIDFFMQKENKTVYWMPFSGTNVPKIKKFGYLAGMKKEIQIHRNIFAYGGILPTLKVILTFCRQQYPVEMVK